MTEKMSFSYNSLCKFAHLQHFPFRECSGSVVECLTRDLDTLGLSLTGVTVLCP